MANEADLRAAISQGRERARKVGPLYSEWDTIFDAEAILSGNQTLLDWGPRERAIDIITARLWRP